VLSLMLVIVLANRPMNVDITSADGLVLKATYYSPGKKGPGIVLFHQCDSTRHVWDAFARALAEAGMASLQAGRRHRRTSPLTTMRPINGWPASPWLIART